MSRDTELYEAKRWLETAAEDLEASRVLLEKEKNSHACFFAQQSGEKGLKALWLAIGEDPWGHSIQKLITEVPDQGARDWMKAVLEDGTILDRYYIPTRYPNGLPDLTPGQVYSRKDGELCISAAARILDRVTHYLGTL